MSTRDLPHLVRDRQSLDEYRAARRERLIVYALELGGLVEEDPQEFCRWLAGILDGVEEQIQGGGSAEVRLRLATVLEQAVRRLRSEAG